MPKFLNTRRAVSELEDLIRNANEKLILVSPYLKLSKDFKELLQFRNSKDKITTIIFGKQELNPDEMKFLQGLRFVILKYYDDLHAKCYLNDDTMIITSLNLYEFSMANNKEMGVLIKKDDTADSCLFEEALNEVDYINQNSKRFEVGSSKSSYVKQTFSKPSERVDSRTANVNSKSTGYCIRTGSEIPFNPERPLSYEAFQVWNQFGDIDYPERFCHFSGEQSKGETSVRRPILYKNWQKARGYNVAL
ncbi:RNA polymerase-binding transcription factor DksA [Pontibacter aydingkolensis]|uniref:Phospholipase D family protein n=1 Tax=Pontibacter aydingkolensis TaxID=1911536 RepID=A0ABS7CYI3_9BACT|nr:phospholipase D family protein [Pontibacter aydingkolensis]MBW7468918.1 phospholipase D family protein [Pontibacter aydingkolensis]